MKSLPSPRSWSLKTKLALSAGLLIFVFSVASASWMLHTLQSDVRRSVADSQASLARSTARDIDQKIEEHRRVVMQSAQVLSRAGIAPGPDMEQFFGTRPALVGMFDVMLVLDAHGRVVHDTSHTPARVGTDLSDRSFVKQAMAGGEGVVSSPFISRPVGAPAMAFASALRSADGRPVGVLIGGLNLLRPNFLGAIGDTRIGRDGHFVLVENGDRPMIVMHRDKSRIMTPVLDGVTRAQLARAGKGHEASEQAVNPLGVETLRSYVSLHSVPWVLAAVYPAAEAFAGLQARGHEMPVIAILACLLTSLLAWWMVHWLLQPLTRLQREMARRADDASTLLPVPDTGSAELAALAAAYNLQSQRRHAFEQGLRASERRLVAITDNVPAMIAHIDTDERYTFVNARYGHIGAGEPQAMLGRSIREVRGDVVYASLAPQAARALSGESVSFETCEIENGATVYRNVSYLPERDDAGAVRGFYAMTLDITQRKEAELRQVASEQKLLQLTNSIPAMVGYFDMQQHCLYANDSGLSSLGVDRAEIPGISMRAALGEALYAQHAPYVEEVLQGRRARLDGKVPFAGREAHFQAHLVPDRSDGGAQRGFYLMTFDITALKEAEGRRALIERQLRAITDNLQVMIAYVDKHERHTFANARFKEWLGIDPADVLGKTVAELRPPNENIRLDRVATSMQLSLRGERVEFDSKLPLASGTLHLHTILIPDILPSGEVAGVYSMSIDMTRQKLAEQQLMLQVRRDTLTGMANRFEFNEVLPVAMARSRRSGLRLALLFLDIDHFKQINDTYGHAVGDGTLKEFARRLLSCLRVTDTAARLSGDEFVVIVEDMNDEFDAQIVAVKIVSEIGQPFVIDGQTLNVTTSLGVACTAGADDPITGPELLAKADAALYRAKAAGRNKFSLSAA